jgi:tetratricopeptide (TPR) repeat protein
MVSLGRRTDTIGDPADLASPAVYRNRTAENQSMKSKMTRVANVFAACLLVFSPMPASASGEVSAIQEGATQEGQAAGIATPEPPPPLPPPGEMARCKALIDRQLFTAARMRLQPIVDRHPGWARATALLALTYYKENRFAVAAPLFRRALELDPEEVAARPFLGWSLYSLGELDEAETMFRSLVERKPEYTPAHYGLGLVALDRDEIESAKRHFERALAGARARRRADPERARRPLPAIPRAAATGRRRGCGPGPGAVRGGQARDAPGAEDPELSVPTPTMDGR